MKPRSIVLAILIGFQSLLAIGVEFHGDSLKGSLGDIIEFGWSIDHGKGTVLTFSDLDLDGTGIEVVDQHQNTTDSGTEIIFQTAVYDSVGIYHFPSMVAYVDSDEVQDSIFLSGPDLEIVSILTPSDTSFHDIKGLHTVRMPVNLFLFMWIAGILFIFFLIYYLIRHYRRSKNVTAERKILVPPEEAHIIALRELEKLKRSKYLRFEQYKVFYSELVHILKQYYENRYLMDALELTTSELIEKMESMTEYDDSQIGATRVILETADYVKFAKGTSNEVEAGGALGDTITIVKQTMIKNDQGEKT